MDVVVIFNGLGNQMSQYAFYLKKKSINKSTYFFTYCSDHNGLELDNVFNINCKESVQQKLLKLLFQLLLTVRFKPVTAPIKALLKLLNCKVIREDFDYNFKEDYLIPSKGTTIYFGGWPSEKYFGDIRKQLLETFRFNEPKDAENQTIINQINSTNSVSIHVRRGDYLNKDNLELFGKVCTKAYYLKAITLITEQVANPHFFVFSNDMAWVKANLPLTNVTFVSCNFKGNSWKDLYLMTQCKHNIVANSSFSWWGAWLNKNEEKIVISPSRYLNDDEYTDFYPESWNRISDH